MSETELRLIRDSGAWEHFAIWGHCDQDLLPLKRLVRSAMREGMMQAAIAIDGDDRVANNYATAIRAEAEKLEGK